MGLAASEAEIRDRASTFIKAELKRAKMTYGDLAEKMKDHGMPEESETTIKAKLKRGTFSAAFFLAAVAAMNLTGVDLSDL
jgi:hypothetical protein